MSAAWSKGSTRAWRRFRLAVLNRDGWRCRMVDPETGKVCGRRLRSSHPDPKHRASVQHLNARAAGGQLLPALEEAVAACTFHNSQDGARVAQSRAAGPGQARTWTW